MGAKSTIEWTEASWNPLTGCEFVSDGCTNCYAARQSAGRLSGHAAYFGLTVKGAKPAKFTGEIRLLPGRLAEPLHWRDPRRVFVNSMSDLFHPDVPDSFISAVFAVMARCPQHTFQILTKRPQRMAALLNDRAYDSDASWLKRDVGVLDVDPDVLDGSAASCFSTGVHDWLDAMTGRRLSYCDLPLPNVWLGTSIETDTYSFRADHLRATPAAVRFISAEPLLGPLPSLDLTDIDWLIVGGESGPGARAMHPQWARDLRDRAVSSSSELALMQEDHDQPVPSAPDSGLSRSRADRPDVESATPREQGAPPPELSSYACERPPRTAFFFKQWGEWLGFAPEQFADSMVIASGLERPHKDWLDGVRRDGFTLVRVGKTIAGRFLDGREWSEYPR